MYLPQSNSYFNIKIPVNTIAAEIILLFRIGSPKNTTATTLAKRTEVSRSAETYGIGALVIAHNTTAYAEKTSALPELRASIFFECVLCILFSRVPERQSLRK